MERTFKKLSLKEQVARGLINKIDYGELLPGDRIKTESIALEFGVSPAPVREAFQCLYTSGHLEYTTHVGFSVARISYQDIDETSQVRCALETASLRVMKTDPRQLSAELDTHYKAMYTACQAISVEDYITHNRNFHLALVRASENRKLIAVWESLHVPRFMRYTLLNTDVKMEQSLEFHVPIIEALQDRDTQQAISALIDHYEHIIVDGAQSDQKSEFQRRTIQHEHTN